MSNAAPCFRRLSLSASVLLACTCNAVAQDCRNDAISKISADDTHLYASSGGVFQFLGQDFIDPGVDWHAGNRISICRDIRVGKTDIFVVKNLERGESLRVFRER